MFFDPFLWIKLLIGHFNREYNPVQFTKPFKFRLGQYSKSPGKGEYPQDGWYQVQTDGWWAPEENEIYYLSKKKDILTISKEKLEDSIEYKWPDLSSQSLINTELDNTCPIHCLIPDEGDYREQAKLAWKYFHSKHR